MKRLLCCMAAGLAVLGFLIAAVDNARIVVQLEQSFVVGGTTASGSGDMRTAKKNLWSYRVKAMEKAEGLSQVQDFRLLHLRSDDGVGVNGGEPIEVEFEHRVISTTGPLIERAFVSFILPTAMPAPAPM
ncbi:MAG: hypothetical protein KC983_07420, partial [Phycisphaerales bacterium]|nr:hypothetical protein [Phycisphaerales bacterium]